MDVGNITFSPKAYDALRIFRDELIAATMWEEEFWKKDYECEELRERINKLQGIVDALGIKSQRNIIRRIDKCHKVCRKSKKK
jgi:hypothetical protein